MQLAVQKSDTINMVIVSQRLLFVENKSLNFVMHRSMVAIVTVCSLHNCLFSHCVLHIKNHLQPSKTFNFTVNMA